MKGFHDAFNLFCKDKFLDDALFPKCCHEYNLFHQINGHEKYGCDEKSMVEEDTFQKDQVISSEISDDKEQIANGSIPRSDQEHHEVDREKFQKKSMLHSVSVVEHSIYEFIELGNDIHDHPSLEINYE